MGVFGRISQNSFSKNILMSVAARVVTLAAGLIVQRQILLAYGSTLNGLTSSITQVMSYLILLEAGLGTASIQALYSPLAADNWPEVSGIFTATDREYKKITALFLGLLIGASLLLPLAVAGQVDYAVAGLLTLVTGGSYVISYILGGKYKAVLSADRKMYVLYALDILSISLSCVFRVLALRVGAGIVWVQLIHLATIGVKNAGYVLYVKRRYPHIDSRIAPNFKAISKRWSVLVHSLAGIVVNHTDVMILTVFASLKTVSVYSVYNLVFSQLSTLIQTTFLQAPQATFGRLYNRDRKQFEGRFALYETAFTVLLFILSTISMIMILPFVRVYTSGVTDINYIDRWLPVLFTAILLMNQIRVPVIMVINITGAFRETQKGAIWEAAINLTVSLMLFFLTDLGLYGLLIGTVCSYLYRTGDVIRYVYQHLLVRKATGLLRTIGVNLLLMAALYILFCVAFPISVSSFLTWLGWACLVSGTVILVYCVGNYVFNGSATKQIVDFVKKFVVR